MADKNEKIINRINLDEVNNIKELIRNLKSGKVFIKDLSDSQKKELYTFLKKEIIRKTIELENKKNDIFSVQKDKLKDIDINSIISKLSEEGKQEFCFFLENIKGIKLS